MGIRTLLRTPTGIVTLAFSVIVVGVAFAAYLLNVPILLVLAGLLLAAFAGFWLVTRTDGDAHQPEPTASTEAPPPQK